MNDFSELEAELKRLRPAAVSPEMMPRIERLLIQTPTAAVLPQPRKVSASWFALGFGLAAAAAFFMLARVNTDHNSQSKTQPLASNTTQTPPAGPTFLPDGMTRVVYDTSDDGLVYPTKLNEPARRLVSRSRETFQWRDASNGASLRVSYPTEEVELVPVSMSVQ